MNGAGGCTLLAEEDLAAALAEGTGGFGVVEQVGEGRVELILVVHDAHGVSLLHASQDIAEVFKGGPHDDGNAELGGLEWVVAAAGGEAAANEGDVGDAVDGGQVADGIENEDGGGGDGRGTGRGSGEELRGEQGGSGGGGEGVGGGEVLRVSRGEDEERTKVGGEALDGVDEELVF